MDDGSSTQAVVANPSGFFWIVVRPTHTEVFRVHEHTVLSQTAHAEPIVVATCSVHRVTPFPDRDVDVAAVLQKESNRSSTVRGVITIMSHI